MSYSVINVYSFYCSIGLHTASEEVRIILDRVHSHLLSDVDDYDTALPWVGVMNTDQTQRYRKATLEAIQEHLGIYPDGTFVPLTFRQRLVFGSPIAKLESKIDKARKRAKQVVKAIRSLENTDDDGRDIALLREFILECLSPFKRYALKANNKAHDDASVRDVSWPVYIIAWAFVTGSLLFFVYWIFAWGVFEGDKVLSSWGAIFGIGAARDILLVQITKNVLLYYLPAIARQPQLLRIRSVLADVSMGYINRYDPLAVSAGVKGTEPIKIIQHTSTACRASRSPELTALPAARLLRQVVMRTVGYPTPCNLPLPHSMF